MGIILRTAYILPVALSAVFLSGCSISHGKDFNSSRVVDIRLLTTTESDIREWFGEPGVRSVKSVEGFESTVHEYRYFVTWPDPLSTARFQKGRRLVVEFRGGVVNAYALNSALEGDDTTFDVDARRDFEIGRTTRRDVEARLGRPKWESMWPTNMLKSEIRARAPKAVSLLWGYERTYVKLENAVWVPHHIGLILFFDPSGNLIGSEFSQSP